MAQWYWQSDLRKRAKDGDKEAWTPYSAEDSAKIEKGFAKKQKSLSLNETYTIVFGCMEQQRKDDKYRRRFIRREELASSTKRKSTSSSSSSAGAADDKEEEDEESGRNKPAPKKQQTALKSQGDYNDIFEESNGDNKATDAAIAKAEKALKKTLPKSYKRLMQHQNGGDIKQEKNCHPASPNTWAKTHVCIESIASIDDLVEEQENWVGEWEYPDIGIYFGSCPSGGHDMIALDYRTCGPKGEPSVVHVDQEANPPYKITFLAPHFSGFLMGLTSETDFEED